MTNEETNPTRPDEASATPSHSPGQVSAESLRQRAKSVLERRPEEIRETPAEDIQDLISELQIHQVELEMQNEELRRTQRALELSRDRYADLYDFAPVGYLTLSETGMILEANLTAAATLGTERGNLIGQPLSCFVEEDDQDTYYVHRRRLLKTETPQVWKMQMVREDGSLFWARVEARTSVDSEGRTVCRASFSDITERRQAEEALRESEERYRSLYDSIRDAILVADTERNIINCNPAFSDLFGYSLDEIRGKKTHYVYESQEEYERLGEALRERMGDPSFLFTVHYRKKSGDVFPGETNVFYLRNDEGKITGFIGLIRDVTKRRRMEEQLRQQAQLAAVGQLAAGIAHDFRNLLTTILIYARMDVNKPDLPSRMTDHLRVIIDESSRAAELVQQILDFSSRALIDPQPLELAAFVRDVLDNVLRRTIPENIRLKLETAAAEPADAFLVEADPGRMQQVLTNLALNARDAMPGGGELRFALSRVDVRAEESPPVAKMEPGSWVCLSVSDTGTGMTEEEQRHLFEPFFTTKDVDKGTGLGLAQVYGIVRQHHGAVDVETAPGRGTTFHLYLPAHGEGREGNGVEASAPASTAPVGRGETILLVEDSPKLREAERSILESLGYRVLSAAHGREALEIYEAEHDVDLVITDIVMPYMSGKALMQELTRSDPHLKALGITGYAVADVAGELREAGFLDVIQKPFDLDTFARRIARALTSSDPG